MTQILVYHPYAISGEFHTVGDYFTVKLQTNNPTSQESETGQVFYQKVSIEGGPPNKKLAKLLRDLADCVEYGWEGV